ncbi:MAG: DUF4403 family protein [Bacteroidetes bacterium]|nr:DUF4403 family protein [Bacteroidota bacterium]MBS1634160.1 DUF4403 family protein [Bacteroidota bacterium]
MKGRISAGLIFIIIIAASCSRKIIPLQPGLSVRSFSVDSVPVSEINIPMQINLQPFYAMAEKNIDTVFTSPGYPDKWEYEGCSIRYKYSFRRGPLQMNAYGNTLNLGFTGYYKVIGSSRACINGTAISPWTPSCKCGFDEGERQVQVSFVNNLVFQPDYRMKLFINRLEPQPLNKCEICFWGQDITTRVMDELKLNLDDAQRNMESLYGTMDFRPRFQQIWDHLNTAYNIFGLGWLKINPQQLRINSLYALNDTLHVFLGLSAKPVIRFEKPADAPVPLPDFSSNAGSPGFNISLNAVLQYDSLGTILNNQVEGLRFDLAKGPVKKKFEVLSCRVYGADNDNIILRLEFGGSAEGTAYLTGKPVYNPSTHILEIKYMDFDVRTKDKFLKTASWLFNRKIVNEISRFTKFDLSAMMDSTQMTFNRQINREWFRGIQSYGAIMDVNLQEIQPLQQSLLLRIRCRGLLGIRVNSANFDF